MSDTENTGIQVYIGDEMPVQTMKDCSVVTATYELGKGMHGTIGIIGPKRMDYAECRRQPEGFESPVGRTDKKRDLERR